MKKWFSLLLAVALLLVAMPAVHAEEQGVRINQVYGGGGKGDTPIANSFVELYNPNDSAVELTGYALVYGEQTLPLTGSIPAKGSYLIVGAAEATTDEFLTYDLPDADLTCDWAISNKSYTIALKRGDETVDAVTAGDSDATKVSKQKSLRRVDHGDTFQIVVWEKASVTVDEAYIALYAPCNSKGECGGVHGAAPVEPEFTPVVTGSERVKGYYDATASLGLELAGRYNSGAMNADGGSLEIVQYNPVNGFAYAVSGVKGKLIAVDLNGSLAGESVVELNGTEYDVKALVQGFAYGDMTSVAISPDGSRLAVAIQAENYADAGVVALFACGADGSLTLLSTAAVGVQPDMVTFADNGTLLTADEGEPRMGSGGSDPKGSVSIVRIGQDAALTVQTVYFDEFDAQREALIAAGVLVQKNAQPSADFEPEYIAVSGGNAFVSLQEANAVAVLDIAAGRFTGVYPLGFVDYGVTKVDLEKNDAIELKTYDNVLGIRMPDGISTMSIGGKTYLLTANEGDSRADWPGLDNEAEGKSSPTGGVSLDSKVVWFNAEMWDGLDTEKDYVFGGRSFSIYEFTGDGLTLVYDSGSGFEEVTAEQLPGYFNASNDKISMDNRSGKKGPEPESVVTGAVDGRIYAFIALERIGGVIVYDVTDPAQAVFVNYINSREFEDAIQGDVSPEGLCFVPAAQRADGKALLLTACEVSGTLAVYACTGNAVTPPPQEEPQPEEEVEHYYPNYEQKEELPEAAEQPVVVPEEDAISPKTGDDGETQLWIVCVLVLSASFVIDGVMKMLAKR
ncbi:MAG: choice-of-anchor I family protein [Candidatus Spyradocola sp.]